MQHFERIIAVMTFFGLNKNSFSNEVGFKDGTTIGKIINEKRKPNPATLAKIVNRFPQVNYDWLLTGQGEMLKEIPVQECIVIEDEPLNINDMKETTTINERIAQLVTALGYKSNRSFAIKIGIAQTSFNAIIKDGTEPKFSTLRGVLDADPNINAEWLMRGRGEMLKQNVQNNYVDKNDGLVGIQGNNNKIENSCKKLYESIKQKDEQINRLLDEISEYRKQNDKLVSKLLKI